MLTILDSDGASFSREPALDDLPPALSAVIRSFAAANATSELLKKYKSGRLLYAQDWHSITRELFQIGYREDLVTAFGLLLIATWSQTMIGEEESFSDFSCRVGSQILSDFIMQPDQDILSSLFEMAAAKGSKEAATFKALLDLAFAGNIEAKRALIAPSLAYWSTWKDDPDCNPGLPNSVVALDELGFVIEFACEVETDPDNQALLASLLFVYGAYADEKTAANILFKSAFAGSDTAWFLLEVWADSGHQDWLYQRFLDFGKKTFLPQED